MVEYRRNDRYITSRGYVHLNGVRGHPLANKWGVVKEHWMAVYEASNRKDVIVNLYRSGWAIHHINGQRGDNRIENLELRARTNHPYGISIDDMAKTLRDLGWEVNAPNAFKK